LPHRSKFLPQFLNVLVNTLQPLAEFVVAHDAAPFALSTVTR
jgi:hypothetical protein